MPANSRVPVRSAAAYAVAERFEETARQTGIGRRYCRLGNEKRKRRVPGNPAVRDTLRLRVWGRIAGPGP